MSAAAADPIADKQAQAALDELRIYSHSPILYWWPVWAVGFLMAFWTWADNHHLVLLPHDAIVMDGVVHQPPGAAAVDTGVHIARSAIPGVVFVVVLLAVAVLSHAYLRGPWSLFIGACVLALGFLLAWLDWWTPLWRWMAYLRIYINMGGYLVISTVLLLVWIANVFVLDRRTCLILTAGQARLRDELGDEEKAFDTGTVSFEKRPYDWFRWLVGWGAGDLVLRAGGPQPQLIELPNVVGVGHRLQRIQQMLRTRDVV